jgi:hypothetical protein
LPLFAAPWPVIGHIAIISAASGYRAVICATLRVICAIFAIFCRASLAVGYRYLPRVVIVVGSIAVRANAVNVVYRAGRHIAGYRHYRHIAPLLAVVPYRATLLAIAPYRHAVIISPRRCYRRASSQHRRRYRRHAAPHCHRVFSAATAGLLLPLLPCHWLLPHRQPVLAVIAVATSSIAVSISVTYRWRAVVICHAVTFAGIAGTAAIAIFQHIGYIAISLATIISSTPNQYRCYLPYRAGYYRCQSYRVIFRRSVIIKPRCRLLRHMPGWLFADCRRLPIAPSQRLTVSYIAIAGYAGAGISLHQPLSPLSLHFATRAPAQMPLNVSRASRDRHRLRCRYLPHRCYCLLICYCYRRFISQRRKRDYIVEDVKRLSVAAVYRLILLRWLTCCQHIAPEPSATFAIAPIVSQTRQPLRQPYCCDIGALLVIAGYLQTAMPVPLFCWRCWMLTAERHHRLALNIQLCDASLLLAIKLADGERSDNAPVNVNHQANGD